MYQFLDFGHNTLGMGLFAPDKSVNQNLPVGLFCGKIKLPEIYD